MAIGQVFGIGAIFWFKDLASKQVNNARRNIQALQKTGQQASFKDIGLVQMGYGLKQAAIGAALLAPHLSAISAANFEENLWRTSNVLSLNAEGMKNLESQIIKMGQNTPFAINDITKALYELGSAGWSAKESMAEVENVMWFGRIANLDYQKSTNMIAKGLKAFGWQTKETTKLMDLFVNLEQQSLIHYEQMPQFIQRVGDAMSSSMHKDPYELVGVASMLVNTGMEPRRAGTSSKQFISTLNYAMYEKDTYRKLQKEYNIKAFDKEGQRLPVTEIMGSINKALVDKYSKAGFKNDMLGTKVAADLSEIFLKNAQAIIPQAQKMIYTPQSGKLKGQELHGLSALQAYIDDLKRQSVNEKKKTFQELNKIKMETMVNQIKTAWVEFGIAIMPVTIQLIKYATVFTKFIAKFAGEHPRIIRVLATFGTITGVFLIAGGAVNFLTGAVNYAVGGYQLLTTATKAQTVANASAVTGMQLAGVALYAVAAALAIYTAKLYGQLLAEQELTRQSEKRAQQETERRATRFGAKYGVSIAAKDAQVVDVYNAIINKARGTDMSKMTDRDKQEFISSQMLKSVESQVKGKFDTSTSSGQAQAADMKKKLLEASQNPEYLRGLQKAIEQANIKLDVKLILDGKEITTAIASYGKTVEEKGGKPTSFVHPELVGILPWIKPGA